jgi:hypothetical protein
MTASPRPTWDGHSPSIRYDARISSCGRYRYELTREFDPRGEWALWIGLNPSTADGRDDDPTLRRMIDFTHGFGIPNLVVTNLYALRSKDPKDVKAAIMRGEDPVGPETNRILRTWLTKAGLVLFAWGYSAKVGKPMLSRAWTVRRDVREAFRAMAADSFTPPPVGHLGLTEGKEKQPRHPLFLPASTRWTRIEP